MALPDRLWQRIRAPFSRAARTVTRLQGDEETRFSLQLPDGHGGRWLELECEIRAHATPHGEHMRARTHLRADFSMVLAAESRQPQALSHLGRGGDRLQSERWGEGPHARTTLRADDRPLPRLVAQALRLPVVQRVLAPLADRHVESWLEVHGTTAPLDSDSGTLLPPGLESLGIRPDPDGPPVQSWEGAAGSDHVHVTTVRLDEREVRSRTARRDALRIAATYAQVTGNTPGAR